jgi:hypothetical protein
MSNGCTVAGCESAHIAKGFCQNHYRVFKRHGTPTPIKPELQVHTATGGYKFITVNGKTTYLHVTAMEQAIGRALIADEEVHHKDGNPANNDIENLVLCANHEEHMILHQRQRASDACGNADFRPCRICGKYDATESMNPHRKQFYHKACLAEQSRNQRAKVKNLTKEPS